MQTNSGKIVYLLPSKIKTSQSVDDTLPSRQKVHQYLPFSSSPLSSPSMLPECTNNHPNVVCAAPSLVAKSNPLSCTEKQKLREVEALEVKLSSYQNVVEKYEKLAEDATTAAIDERKAQLKKLEEQLWKREQKAKNKLANAINVMEESQTIESTIPMITSQPLNQDDVQSLGMVVAQMSDGKPCY